MKRRIDKISHSEDNQLKCNALPRREFLKGAGLLALAAGVPVGRLGTYPASDCAVVHTLRIRKSRVELAAGHVIATTTYNGRVPGPTLRAVVGQRTIVDVYNETADPERIHWLGMGLDAAHDVPAGAMRRVALTPTRAGVSFYHSDVTAAADLGAGLYSGQAGLLLVDPAAKRGDYDREVLLLLKEFEPYLLRGQHGCEVGYRLFTINGHLLGHGDPIRVVAGERVLFHVVNASATETRVIGLPEHQFQVVALDGNPVPTSRRVATLRVAPTERVSAVVDMHSPGVWILGDLSDEDRTRGMGTTVEYAGRRGEAQWHRPAHEPWDYTWFGSERMRAPAEPLDLVIAHTSAPRGGFKRWSLNDAQGSALRPLQVGSRYRLRIRNASDDFCTLQLRQHPLELAAVDDCPTAGVVKDVMGIGPRGRVEVEFVARNVGRALLQSSRQLYRDFGLMAMLEFEEKG
jgi:FtsP/CotA-like multicopper oxidase with cupredoxin domain